MSEDSRTLWVGNLENKVTDELIYELFLQAGPIERLVFPTEGEGEEKKHKGHAYIVFKHPESVQYSTQVMDGTTLFSELLSMKARSLPATYKKESDFVGNNVPSIMSNKGRFDNSSSLRGSFNRGRWQQDSFSPQARQYNNFNNQINAGGWLATQQGGSNVNLQDKRQRILQQQNVLIDAHRQMPQPQQMYTQQFSMQQQQPWMNNSYNWNMGYQQTFQTDQYGQYYPQQ